MIYEFDFYNRYEKPDLILCDSYDEEIGMIPQYEDLKITINLDEVSDLSYKIYAADYNTRYPEFKSSRAYLSGDIVMHERVLYQRIADSTAPGEWNEAEWTEFTPSGDADTINDPAIADVYKMHAERRQIHVAGIGYFVITAVDENVDDDGIYKEITAKSCEYELTNITAPYVEGTYELYTTESYAQLDNYDRFKYLADMAESENVADDDTGMYHSDNCLLFELLCYAPSWRLSPRTIEKLTTDPKYESLATSHRTYDDEDRTLYSFFKDIISDSYECFITFDCEHRYIEIYTYDDALTEIGVVLSEANILDSCEVSTTIDDYVNCLKVKGGTDDINISTFNPLGNRLIYNFAHDMATGIISGELKQALEYWQDKINSDDFNKVEVTWGANAQAQIPYEVFDFGDGDDASPLYNFIYTVSRSFREWMTAYNNAMATGTYFDTPAPKMTLLASGLSHSYELEIHNALDATDMMTVWSGDETNPTSGYGYAEMAYTPASGQASAEQQAAAVYNQLQSSALSRLYSFNYTTGENTIRLTPKHNNDTYLYLPTDTSGNLGAYFDLGDYRFKTTSRIEIDAQILSPISQDVLFIAGSGNAKYEMYIHANLGWAYYRCSSSNVWLNNAPAQPTRQTYIFDNKGNRIIINGQQVSSMSTTTASRNANSNLYLFGFPSTSATRFGNARIYGIKIYDNDVLQFDLVPAYDYSANKAGLRDTVHNTFFANANTSTNALQPVVKLSSELMDSEDDFNPPAVKITSADNRNVVGSAFISAVSASRTYMNIEQGSDGHKVYFETDDDGTTGYIMKPNSIIEMDLQLTSVIKETRLFSTIKRTSSGSLDTNTTTYSMYINNSGKWAYHLGTSGVGTSIVPDTNLHTYTYDVSNLTIAIDNNVVSMNPGSIQNSAVPLTLFAFDSRATTNTNAKIYGVRIYEKDAGSSAKTLIHNYVPSYHPENNRVCLYDTVSGVYLESPDLQPTIEIGDAVLSSTNSTPIVLGADYNYSELNNYMRIQPIAYVYGFDENGKVTYEDKQAITWKTTYDTAVTRSIPDIKKARLYLETETDIINSEIYYIDAFIKGLDAQRSAVQSQLLTSAEVSDTDLDAETQAARGDLIARQVQAMTNTLAAFYDQKNVLLMMSKEIESWANALKNIIEENINYNGFQEIFKEFAATSIANGGLGLSDGNGVNGEMSDAELKAMKLYNKLSRLIKQQTYTGENFIITDTDTMDEKFAQERALYNKGVEMLAKLSQPSAEVKVDAEPFMFNTDYHDVTQDIKMGTAIYIEMPSGEVPLYHLNKVVIEYDDPSCELTFGNRIRSNNPADIFADIQNVAASTADIVASNRIDWGVNTQRVNQLMLEKDADINTTARAMANSINNVSLSSEGLKCFAKDPLTGEDTFGIWGANGCIMFQEPDGQGGYTNKAAIGRIIHTDGSVSYGFYGDRILANTITAEKLAVGTITHGGSNYLKNGSFEGLDVDENTKTYISFTVGTKPSDWNTNYSSYYTKSGNSYIRNTSSTWGRTTQYYKDDSFYIIEWYEGDSGTNALGYGFTGKIAQNGSHCLKLNQTNTSVHQNVTGLTAGTYTLSYYYKRNTQGNLQISIKEIISSNNERTLATKSYDKATSNDTGWTKDYLQTTVNDNASIKVVIAATGATGDTFVDSVMLDKSNYVGEYSPHSSEEYAAYTAIDGNGVRIYSGKLQMYDSSGALVFNADQSGNLWLKGMVEATSGKLGSWTLDANTIHSDEYKTGISLQNKTGTKESAAFWAGYRPEDGGPPRTAPPRYNINNDGSPTLTGLPTYTNFMVTQNGTLYAKGAHISGYITLTGMDNNSKGSILDYLFTDGYQNDNDAHTVLTNSNLWNGNEDSDGLITVSQAGSMYMSSNTQVNGLGGTITSSQMGNMGGFNWSTADATNSTTVPAPAIQNGGYYLYLSGAPHLAIDPIILAGIKDTDGSVKTASYTPITFDEEPSDWGDKYSLYYTKSGNSYTQNTSPTWSSNTQYYTVTDYTYFKVLADGTLYARNANIKGKITADSIVTNHLTVLEDGNGSELFSLNLAAGDGSNAGHIIYNSSGMSVQFGNQANGNCIKYTSTGGTAVYLGGFTYQSGYTQLEQSPDAPDGWADNWGMYYIESDNSYTQNTSQNYDPNTTYYQYNDTNLGGWKVGDYTLFNRNAGAKDDPGYLIHAGPNFNVSNTGILKTVSAELSGTLTTRAEGTATVIKGASINLVNNPDNPSAYGPAISLATQQVTGSSSEYSFSLWKLLTGDSPPNLSDCEIGLYSPGQIIFGQRTGENSTKPAFVMDYTSKTGPFVFRGAATNEMNLGSTLYPWKRIYLPTAGGTTGTALETNGSALSISFGEILGDMLNRVFNFDFSLAFSLMNLNRLKFDGRDVMTAADTVLISFIIAQYVKRVILYPLNSGIV